MFTTAILCLLWGTFSALAQGPASQLRNGAFLGDADGDGLADGWEYAPGASRETLDVTFGLEELSPDRFAQRMSCTRFGGGHAMICQVGVVSVRGGQWYQITLRARGEGVRQAWVGVHDTNGWKACGPWYAMSLGRRWRDYKFRFQANHDCHETSRFQIWFTSTGTLWVSDVSFTEAEPPARANILPKAGGKNLLPNPGFEALGGWGMVNYWNYGWTVARGQGLDGTNCAAIEWRPNDPEFGYYFDYFEMQERRLVRPWVQAIGYIPLEPGETYTLSAYMRCDRSGAPAYLGLRGPGAWSEKRVRLTTEWQRFSVSCPAGGDITLAQVGPAFEEADIAEFEGCTTYIDNVQLERGPVATDFEPPALEVLLPHCLESCAAIEPRALELAPSIIARQRGDVVLRLTVTGFDDSQIIAQEQRRSVTPGATPASFRFELPGPGFYRAMVEARMGEHVARATGRLALCLAPPDPDDTPFGLNHAYAFNGQLRLARQLGLSWVRDWSLKWDHIEPQPGSFTFQRSDFQINRARGLGMNVLCMFPFPAAEWSSTAPRELRTNDYPGIRIRQAYAPKDAADLERYVFQCVSHYKDRVRVWEVFNESIYTDYSLPKSHGYKPEDYVPLLKAVYEGCKRADPGCQVIGGYSAPPGNLLLYEAMFRNGGLSVCDLVSLHIYPGGAPDFLQGDFDTFNALMDQNGGRKPAWMTEYAYYADDDADPVRRGWPDLLESEWQQAAWNTRACIIMLANGCERIFYHIWPTSLNQDIGSLIFFEYAGAPRKIAATQAAMAYLLGSRPQCVVKLTELSEDVLAYVFEAPPHLRAGGQDEYITALWLTGGTADLPRLEGVAYLDACGGPLPGPRITLSEAPVYLLTRGQGLKALEGALRRTLEQAGVM